MKKKISIVHDPQLIFEEAQTNITHNNLLMIEAIEAKNLNDTLKYAEAVTKELRNPMLELKHYYIICNFV